MFFDVLIIFCIIFIPILTHEVGHILTIKIMRKKGHEIFYAFPVIQYIPNLSISKKENRINNLKVVLSGLIPSLLIGIVMAYITVLILRINMVRDFGGEAIGYVNENFAFLMIKNYILLSFILILYSITTDIPYISKKFYK